MALETIDPNVPEAGSTTTGGLGTYSPSVPYKVVPGGKNQLSTITPTSGMLMSPEASGAIKNNMADLLKKYQNPYDEFQSTLDDMVARTQLRPADALRQRAEERQQKEANIYNLKMSMANNEAAQASAKTMAAAMGLGGGTPGGVPLAPGISSQAPGGGQGTMAPTWMDMLKSLPVEQQPIGMAYISGGDIGNFNKLVSENSMKRSELQKNLDAADKLPPEERDLRRRHILKDAYGPQSYINEKGKTVQFTAPGAMPGVAPATRGGGGGYTLGAPVVTGTSALSPTATEYVESRGRPSAVSPAGAEGVMQVMPNTQRDPGFGVAPAKDNTPGELKRVGVDYLAALKKHYGDETLGIIAYNMGPGNFDNWIKTTGGDFKKLSPETQSYIGQVHLANSLLNRGGDNVVTRTMGGNQPVSGGAQTSTPSGINQVPQEDVKLQQENLGRANTSFMKGTYDPLAERVNAQEGQRVFVDSILKAVETGDYGPGTSIGQMTSQAAQAVGLPLSQAERENYLRNLTIENAKKQFVASGAKAAMGSQYTAKESENFEKTLAGINDPKEYIKSVYQIKRASALVDEAHKQFLEDNAGDMIKAEREWKKSGIRDKIFTETVDAFKKKPSESKSEVTSTAKPPTGAPPDAKLGTDASGKPGWFVVRDGKTLQWKP